MTVKVHELIGHKVEVTVNHAEGGLYAKTYGVLAAFSETESYVSWNYKDVHDTLKAAVDGYDVTFTSLEVDDTSVTV